MEGISPYFGTVDYCVFAIMLLVSVLIGIYMSFKGNKTPEDFLMGNRSFHPVPIAMSLLTSIVSSISLLGFSGEIYLYGVQFSLLLSGAVTGTMAAKYITLPVIYPLQLTSVNEYIQLRFHSKRLRSAILLLFSFQALIYLGVCLYAPTIALSSVTPFSTNTYIYLLGGICTLYSTIGGIKAVVWTDVFQLCVMIIGLLTIVILGCTNLGGLVKVWSISEEGHRLDLFNFNMSIYQRHSFLYLTLFGFLFFFGIYGISQINVQRMCAVKTLKDANKILNYNMAGMLFVYFFIFTGGLMGYATYASEGCDPFASGKIEKGEQILSFFVVDKLGHIWGLPGLFVATLIGGTLSSLSSVISAMVAQIWNDGFLKFQKFRNASPTLATMINKVISLVLGVLMIGMAILTSNANNLAQFNSTISGAAFGPVLGVFLLGMLFPRCSVKGAWAGLIISYLFMCWLTVGSFLYGPKVEHLPFITENCNSTFLDLQVSNTTWISEEEEEEQFFLQKYLYSISYTLFVVIGPVMCIVIGMLVSCLTGFTDIKDVSPEHITPFVRNWYWKNKETHKEEVQKKMMNNFDDLED